MEKHKFRSPPKDPLCCSKCGFERSHPNHILPVTLKQAREMAAAMRAPRARKERK